MRDALRVELVGVLLVEVLANVRLDEARLAVERLEREQLVDDGQRLVEALEFAQHFCPVEQIGDARHIVPTRLGARQLKADERLVELARGAEAIAELVEEARLELSSERVRGLFEAQRAAF